MGQIQMAREHGTPQVLDQGPPGGHRKGGILGDESLGVIRPSNRGREAQPPRGQDNPHGRNGGDHPHAPGPA